jgi:putative aminopeptidase FrvX
MASAYEPAAFAASVIAVGFGRAVAYTASTMTRSELLGLAERVLRLPTAPYHEQAVREFVEQFCRALGLRVSRDKAGNVMARYRCGTTAGPLVFVAHMDHPGFEMLGGNRAEFFGGVPKDVFAGARIRVFGKNGASRARIARVLADQWPRRKLVELAGNGRFRRGELAMWEVPAFRVRGGLLRARAIDDLLGAAAVLATLEEVVRRKLRAHVWGVFTRAEEAGFCGAMALARAGRIPKGALVVSVEMSRQRPWARVGDGVVVRVGDRASVFDAAATAFLAAVAERAAVRAQRCLMDGGTCEATVFAGFGYRAGGLCVPLGNYHNVGRDGRPSAEYVSVSDVEQLVELMVAAAGRWRGFGRLGAELRRRLLRISRSAPRRLSER